MTPLALKMMNWTRRKLAWKKTSKKPENPVKKRIQVNKGSVPLVVSKSTWAPLFVWYAETLFPEAVSSPLTTEVLFSSLNAEPTWPQRRQEEMPKPMLWHR